MGFKMKPPSFHNQDQQPEVIHKKLEEDVIAEANKDGSIYADEAWANITNIEIACDLSDESVDEWGSPLAEEYRKKLMGEDDPVFKGHLKHMESVDEYSSKYKAIK